MTDKLIYLDMKIQKLKQKKEKIQTQLALSFLKETKRICGHEFSPALVLTVLDQVWTLSSEIQKQEWKKCGHSFRLPPAQKDGKKASTSHPTHHQV